MHIPSHGAAIDSDSSCDFALRKALAMKFHYLLVASASTIASRMINFLGTRLVIRRFRRCGGFDVRGHHRCSFLHVKVTSRCQELLRMTIGDAGHSLS